MTQHIGAFEGKEGEPLHIESTGATARYAVTCLATGTRVEFTVEAGQKFTVIRGTSHVKVDLLATIPAQQPPGELEELQAPLGLVH
ncbi:hypothetical protein [Azohydromonas lata]|uniref:Uncharacterized protein n=1 Tax=Azohydromonas lata TaxID=45677 RepID=A0ABU5IIN9_9BURK|nr:hypothetical protein [Azohydromonas lata]MDZ5457878.1 hypothetical protein [Azohydromonas lata]